MMGETHHLHPPHHLFNSLDHPIASTIPSCRVYHRHSHRSVQRPGLFVACKKKQNWSPGFNKQCGFQPGRPKKNWKSAKSARSRSIKQLRRCKLKQIRNQLSWLVVDHSGWGHSSETYYAILYPLSIFWVWDTNKKQGKRFLKNPGEFSVVFRATQRNKSLHPKVSLVVKCYYYSVHHSQSRPKIVHTVDLVKLGHKGKPSKINKLNRGRAQCSAGAKFSIFNQL